MSRRANGVRLNLQEATALLVQTQAAFIREMAEINRRYNELKAQSDARFLAIEREFEEIKAILRELPEAIGQRIGFKAK